MEEVLGLVSANFGSTIEATSTANSLISGRSSASLRGLGARRTLVLLNGRRIGNYAFSGNFGGGVDLHAIPLAAIDRLEVLKDGASALYGCDAIGGVINFVTRRDFAEVDLFGSYTKTEAGGADSGRAALAAGTGRFESDGFNVFGVLDLRNAERLKGSDRSFSTQTFHPELGAVSNGFGQNTTAADEELMKARQAMVDRYAAAIARRDIAAAAADLYATDAIIQSLCPESPRAFGPEGYTKRVEAALKSGFGNYVGTVKEAHVLADSRAWTTGTCTLSVNDKDGKPEHARGNWIDMLRREGNEWKVSFQAYARTPC